MKGWGTLLALYLAGDAEEGSGAHQHRVAVEDRLPHHHVHEAGLVLQGHEGDPGGGGGPLTAQNQAGIAQSRAVPGGVDGAGVGEPPGRE